MISKTKILLHSRQTNGSLLVRRRDLLLGWASEEVQINASTDRTPCNILRTHEDLLAVRIAQVNTVRVGDIIISGARIAGNKGQIAGGLIDFEISSLQVEGV